MTNTLDTPIVTVIPGAQYTLHVINGSGSPLEIAHVFANGDIAVHTDTAGTPVTVSAGASAMMDFTALGIKMEFTPALSSITYALVRKI